MKLLTTFQLFILGLLTSIDSYAQKVPNTQTQNRWAKDILIDGKLDDWGPKLLAYNKENRFWYTVANDHKFLYLAIRKDENANKAYTNGGIKLFISPDGIKNTERLPAITFPVSFLDGTNTKRKEWDVIRGNNILGIKDTLFSIYNEYGIQVGWTLENKEEGPIFCYELAIPLELVGITSSQQSFSYNILLRGFRKVPLPPGLVSPILNSTPMSSPSHYKISDQTLLDMDTWTDFWATYTLAENPDK